MRLELLNGANGMCISLNNTRITDPKIYGILTPIMVWEVPDERIRQILDEREPARHGRWVHRMVHDEFSRKDCFRCSECRLTLDYESNYCPMCGAKMDGGEASETD